MRRTLVGVLAVVAMLVPAVASAESFYTAIRGGPAITPDQDTGPAGGQHGPLEFKTGFAGGAALGYYLPFGLRVEGELGFLYSPVKRESQFQVDLDGSIKSYLGMANVYYDVKLPFLGPFTPYLGGGIGAARVNYDHEFFSPVFGKGNVDEWRTALAYQARGGIIYALNNWFDLSLGYRYVHVDSGHFTNDHGPTGPLRVNVGSMDNHSVEMGFAIKF